MHFSPQNIDFLAFLTLILFGSMLVVQLFFTLFVHGSLLRKTTNKTSQVFVPLSVIICARNESDNLANNLPFVLEQDYPTFEVIVVNHQSTDDSKYILHTLKKRYSHLRIIEVARNVHQKAGKKLPLSIGIKGAKYENMIFTDADCQPASFNWLKKISSQFSEKCEIVMGYGPYTKTEGWLNAVIRFDTVWIAMNYLGSAKFGFPYMAVGRNLAYTKSSYQKANGFKSHYSVLSGDDDLFIQDAAKNRNYTICLDPESFCYSAPKETWSEWLFQKNRHISTSEHYKVFKKWMLGIYPLSLFLLLVSFVTLLFNEHYRWWSFAAFTLVFVVKWIVQGKIYLRLKEKSFIPFLPFLEIGYFLLLPYLFYNSVGKRMERWK